MYNISWKIEFTKSGGEVYELRMIDSCQVVHDEEQLSDTARIVLPATFMNRTLQIDDKITRGDKITIWMGYDAALVKEFEGYIREINTNESSLNIECEDGLFQFRKEVKNRILKNISIKSIAETLIQELGLPMKVQANVTINYDKFTIHQATAYDVLKKIQEETKLDIYLKNDTLYMSGLYLHKTGDVIYDLSKNVEKADLTYKTKEDRKVQVEITYTDAQGKAHTYTTGTSGGTKIEKRAETSDPKSLQAIAEQELIKNSFDGYEGSITGWLIPYVETGYTVQVVDNDYPKKNGLYYAKKVTTTVSSSGGVRQVDLGIKLSN